METPKKDKNPPLWFTCFHGLALSNNYRAMFYDYLKEKGLPKIEIKITGVDQLYRISDFRDKIKSAKVIVDLLPKNSGPLVNGKFLESKDFAPNAKILYYDQIPMKKNKEYCMNKIYEFYLNAIKK